MSILEYNIILTSSFVAGLITSNILLFKREKTTTIGFCMSDCCCWCFFLFPRCVNRHPVPFSLYSSDYLCIQMRTIMRSIKLWTLNVHVPETFVSTSSVTKLFPAIGRYVFFLLFSPSIKNKYIERIELIRMTVFRSQSSIYGNESIWFAFVFFFCLFCWERAHANAFNKIGSTHSYCVCGGAILAYI